jgi:2-C-methyl-D-erythritol 2,4-cyclodiphosphate synthase
LVETKKIITANGWQINNIDATVIAEKPRLREYIDIMREHLSRALDLPLSQVSVKASTANQVGPLGHEEAIAAMAIASLQKTN